MLLCEIRKVRFGKIFGRSRPSKIEDPFELLPLCRELGLESKAASIVRACRPSVAIDPAERRADLPHSGSSLGGTPALPDRFVWPSNEEGKPLHFLGQFACSELVLAKLTGLPEEGLISVFLDALEDEPSKVRVYHFSLKSDLMRRRTPSELAERPAFRPSFHTIPSLPRPGSPEYRALALNEEEQDAYYQLLLDLEESLEPCHLRCGGHPPFCQEDGCYPTDGGAGAWDFFLALRDIEELEVTWPETGAIMIWLPKSQRLSHSGEATLTWQDVDDDWDDDEESDGDEDDDEDDEEE